MKIKPTGLKGGDKIQRIQNLMDRMTPLNESTTNSTLEHVKYGPDGMSYGIIRENHTYFIKTCKNSDKNLTTEDFSYIGGLKNKMLESYKSYEEALKHLNMKFKDLNESYGIRENINLFKSDILVESVENEEITTEQEEETKFKLKVDAPTPVSTDVPMEMPSEEPMEEPMEDTMPEPSMDVPTEDVPEETEVEDETGEDTGDLEKDIQRLTGKIGQKMRELDEPDPELEKYVINSIMSALDIDSMDDDFKEDLISKLEGEEEGKDKEEEPTDVETSEEEPTDIESTEEESSEELPKEESVKKESRIINKKTLLENLRKKTLVENRKKFDLYDEENDEDIESFLNKRKFNLGRNKINNKEIESRRDFKSILDRFKSGEKKIKNPNLYDDSEQIDEVEQMQVFKKGEFDPSKLKAGTYGYKDDLGKIKSISVNEEEEETIYEIDLDEDWMEEGNKFTDMLRKTKKGDTFKLGKKSYKDTSNLDEDDNFDFDVDFEIDTDFDVEPFLRKTKFDFKKDMDLDGNGISDRLEIKSDRPTTTPVPVKTPTPTTPSIPRRDRPFKPKTSPKIQPKGRYGL
jgi:hypothetical protein